MMAHTERIVHRGINWSLSVGNIIPSASALTVPSGEHCKGGAGPCISTYSPRAASLIALMMEAVRASETSVNPHQSTRRYNPEDSHLHSQRRENLKNI
jgi:hypothetical protein